MQLNLQTLPADASFDVVVIGAGGAGMAAALFAAIDGASVLLVEHTACFVVSVDSRRGKGASGQAAARG